MMSLPLTSLVALDHDGGVTKIVFEGQPTSAIRQHVGIQRLNRVQGCAHPA
jgi:hypothetical protein